MRRGTDIVGRLGVEEFVLLLPETNETGANLVAERLRKQIEEHTGIFPETQISVSIGMAGATLGMSSFEVMLRRADEALYEAKRGGRNRVVIAPRQLSEKYEAAAQ
jgi:diguanylate cyclase (GGDEF)-like protein